MYDSTRPELIPGGAEYLAIYANGDYAADRDQVQATRPGARIFTIDVLGSDPAASIKDIENYDLQPEDIPRVVSDRFDAYPDGLTRLYCNLSTWSVARVYARRLSPRVRRTIRWWIANPTNPAYAHFVPGSNATQYSWGTDWDLSVIGRNFIGG